MFEFFLGNAGGKMKMLAKIVICLSLVGAVALLISGIAISASGNDAESFPIFLLAAAAALIGGWVLALAFQCLGEAAAPGMARSLSGGGTESKAQSGWTCKCGRANEPGRSVCPRCGADRR